MHYSTCVAIKWSWTCGWKDHKGTALIIQEVTHSKKSAVAQNNNVILYWSAHHREITAPSQLQSSRTKDQSDTWIEACMQLDHLKGCHSLRMCSYLKGGRCSRCSNVITVHSLSRAVVDKLGLMGTAGEGAAISVWPHAVPCAWPHVWCTSFLCVWEGVCPRGERDENNPEWSKKSTMSNIPHVIHYTNALLLSMQKMQSTLNYSND